MAHDAYLNSNVLILTKLPNYNLKNLQDIQSSPVCEVKLSCVIR
jgi:hypothetical protein